MNYHIMVQDKFVDSYIQDIYDIGYEASNVFWLRGHKGDSPYVNTLKEVEYIGIDKTEIKAKLNQLKPSDNIFIHWYDMWVAELVMDLPNKLFVILWGGDFFGDPIIYHMNWLYDKETLNFEKLKLQLKLSWRKNVFEMYKQFKNIKRVYELAKIQFINKSKQVSRIDYIILAGENASDFLKTKQLYPEFKAKHLAGFYDSNFDLSADLPVQETKKHDKINILLGNSATSSNNHLDAFKVLRKVPNIKIYCTLSYGDAHYRDLIIAEGKKIFKDDFVPVVDFMSREDYSQFLNEMDIVYMFHNRSQAFGNIIMAMAMGKPIFMKTSNSLKQNINDLNIVNYDANLIDQIDLQKAIETAKLNREKNIDIIKTQYSKTKRLQDLKRIMEVYAI